MWNIKNIYDNSNCNFNRIINAPFVTLVKIFVSRDLFLWT